jgi:hypothetical protein
VSDSIDDTQSAAERLAAFLREPGYAIHTILLVAYQAQQAGSGLLLVDSAEATKEAVEVWFRDPVVTRYRRRLRIEGPEGVGPAKTPDHWQVTSARRLFWDGQEIGIVPGVRPVVEIGRVRRLLQ